jgi:hypothetical protein
VQTGTIDVSQSTVNFSVSLFDEIPSPQALRVDFDAPQVTAGTLPGERLPSWLDVVLTQTGDTVGQLTFEILDTSLDPGTYDTTIRLVSSNEAGTNILDTVDIPVTYTVNPITLLETNVSQLTVELAPIQQPVISTITLLGEGVMWDTLNFDPNILTVSPTSGTIPAGGQEVEITITPDPRAFVTTTGFGITFFEQGRERNEAFLDIDVILVDGLLTDPLEVSLTATEGSVDTQSQTVTLDRFERGAAEPLNWLASSDQSWLTISPTSGSIPANASDNNLPAIAVSADPTGLPPGILTGVVTFTNDLTNQIFELPVNLVVSQRNMKSSRRGVAFSSLSSLQQSISLTDNIGDDVPWEATSDADWLIVTPSGAAGDALLLTADPISLANNSLFEARVTVTSPLTDIANEVVINVGLWNSDEAPENITINQAEGVFGFEDVVIADPIRPYVYTLGFGDFSQSSDVDSTLTAFNVYTGEVVGGPVTTRIRGASEIVISDDGSSLFVIPTSNNGSDRQFERFDLADLTSLALFDIPANLPSGGSEFIRVNAIPYIITATGGVIDPETGEILSNLSQIDGSNLVASQSNVACLRNFAIPSSRVDCFDFLGTGIAGMEIAASRRNIVPISGDTPIQGISPDGSVIYINQQAMISALATDDSQTELLSLGMDIENTFVGASGLIGGIGLDEDFISGIVSVFDADGTFIGQTTIIDGLFSTAIFSGDENRLIVITESFDGEGSGQTLEFIDAPE